MLQVGRKLGESVVIGDSIKVTVIDVKGKTARLGFEFLEGAFDDNADEKRVLPSIHREEVYNRIQKENREAAESTHLLKWLKKRQGPNEKRSV